MSRSRLKNVGAAKLLRVADPRSATFGFLRVHSWLIFSDLHRFEFSQIPRRFADFLGEMIQFLDLRLGEQQAAVLLGKLAVPRLRLAGQQALLVAVTENVGDDRL